MYVCVLYVYVCVCVAMPTRRTIMCLVFHTRQIDGVCGLISIQEPLGQSTLHVGRV